MDPKIRLRTPDELEHQYRGLLELCAVMRRLGLPYFIGGGTLLGIVRDGAFIQWDWDVELDVRVEEVFHRRGDLISALSQAGFIILRSDESFINFKLKIGGFGAVYEVLGWQRIGAFRYRRAYRLPAGLFETQSTLAFNGERFSTYSDPMACLTYLYGDWRKPIRTADKSAYVAPQCARPPTRASRCRGWMSGWVSRFLRRVARRAPVLST